MKTGHQLQSKMPERNNDMTKSEQFLMGDAKRRELLTVAENYQYLHMLFDGAQCLGANITMGSEVAQPWVVVIEWFQTLRVVRDAGDLRYVVDLKQPDFRDIGTFLLHCIELNNADRTTSSPAYA